MAFYKVSIFYIQKVFFLQRFHVLSFLLISCCNNLIFFFIFKLDDDLKSYLTFLVCLALLHSIKLRVFLIIWLTFANNFLHEVLGLVELVGSAN